MPLAPLRSWGVLTGHQASRLLCTCALITPRRHSAPSPAAAPSPFPRESSQSGPPCCAGRPRAAKAVAPLAPASARPPPPGSCRQHMCPPQSLRSHKLSSALRACFSSLCPCPSLPTSQKLTRCQRGRSLPGPRAHPHRGHPRSWCWHRFSYPSPPKVSPAFWYGGHSAPCRKLGLPRDHDAGRPAALPQPPLLPLLCPTPSPGPYPLCAHSPLAPLVLLCLPEDRNPSCHPLCPCAGLAAPGAGHRGHQGSRSRSSPPPSAPAYRCGPGSRP